MIFQKILHKNAANRSVLGRLGLFVLGLMMVLGYALNHSKQPKISGDETSHLQVVFAQMPIPLEEAVTLNLRFNPELKVREIWVEGINMYMGKTPVYIEQQQVGRAEASLILASCSEPNMRWRMFVQFEVVDGVLGQEMERHSNPFLVNTFEFSTSR